MSKNQQNPSTGAAASRDASRSRVGAGVEGSRAGSARAAGTGAEHVDALQIANVINPKITPTPEQQDMIEAPFVPLLVMAGAGAGKTETMSQRVLYAVANGVASPGEILGLTFTRKAAGELSERIRTRLRTLRGSGLWRPADESPRGSSPRDSAATGGSLELGRGLGADGGHETSGGPGSSGSLESGGGPGTSGGLEAERPRVTTYNAFAAEIVSEFALRIGEDPAAALMTDARRWQIAEQVVTTWPHDLPTDKALSTIVDAVLQLSGALDEHLKTEDEACRELLDLAEDFKIAKPKIKPSDAQVSLEVRAELMPLVQEFRRRALEEGLIDFGGQVALAVKIAQVPEVRAALRERYPVVMLDEYQDTSVAQVALLSALFGDGHAVTAVGDPQQAIYGWRGASAGAMHQFHANFRSQGHDARTLSLATSWRNEAKILEFANEVARVGGRADGDQPTLDPRPGAGPGVIRRHRAADLAGEAAAIAEHFATTWNVEYRRWEQSRGQGSSQENSRGTGAEAGAQAGVDAGHDGRAEPPKKRSAAILCRRRKLFPILARALEERGVPYRIVGRGGLLQQREVADIRALLTVVAHPERGDAAVHLLHRLRLGAKDLAALHAQARGAVQDSLATLGADREQRERVDVRDEASLGEVLSRPAGGYPGEEAGAESTPFGEVLSRPAGGYPGEEAGAESAPFGEARKPQESADSAGAGEPGLGSSGAEVAPGRDPWVRADRFALSDAGRERLTWLLGVLDAVRAQRTLPLGELVVLAERLLGLDIEIAARGDRGARAAVDAFVREATRFAADAPGAQLSTFLGWLDQLEQHERVDMPEEDISGVDTEVLIMTVHAAKGLEWDVVAVPELNEGRFPGYDSNPCEDGTVTDSAWLTNLGSLPYPLRGDHADLPDFGKDDVPFLAGGWEKKQDLEDAIKAFKREAGAHSIREERNVAYVAFTRARSELILTSSDAERRGLVLPESRFVVGPLRKLGADFVEPLAGLEGAIGNGMTGDGVQGDGAGTEDYGADAAGTPATGTSEAPTIGDAGQPTDSQPDADVCDAWPSDLLTPRRRKVLNVVADAVRDAQWEPGRSPGALPPLPEDADARVASWWRESELLLAERKRQQDRAAADVLDGTGAKLSVTTLTNAGKNAQYTARNILRPIPRPPSYATARGTSLHEWIEQHYRRATLDASAEGANAASAASADAAVGDMFDAAAEVTADMRRLREVFAASRWAHRVPVALETELTLYVDGVLVPGKADAVFDDAEGCAVVDWKTTAVPSGAELERLSLQLHAYRLAWARRSGRPIEEVGGYFVHIKSNEAEPHEVGVPRLGERQVLDLLRGAIGALRDGVRNVAGASVAGAAGAAAGVAAGAAAAGAVGPVAGVAASAGHAGVDSAGVSLVATLSGVVDAAGQLEPEGWEVEDPALGRGRVDLDG